MACDEHPVQGIDASGEQVDVWKNLVGSLRISPQSSSTPSAKRRWPTVTAGLSVRRERQAGRPSALRAAAIHFTCLCTRRHRMFTVGHDVESRRVDPRPQLSKSVRRLKIDRCPYWCHSLRGKQYPHLSLLIRQLTMTRAHPRTERDSARLTEKTWFREMEDPFTSYLQSGCSMIPFPRNCSWKGCLSAIQLS